MIMNRRLFTLILSLLCAMHLVAAASEECMLFPVSLQERCAQSTAIVEGKVKIERIQHSARLHHDLRPDAGGVAHRHQQRLHAGLSMSMNVQVRPNRPDRWRPRAWTP